MSVALLESSFFKTPITSNFKSHKRAVPVPVKHVFISCRQSPDEDGVTRRIENQLAKLALVAMAAGVLTLSSVDPAAAAKTGGRVGGQAFRSSAPKSSGPRINNSRSNVYINPPVAPPLVGGYGYGYGYGVPFYGGWGWSPFSFFSPGPSVAVGVGGGLDFFLIFIVIGAVSALVRRFRGPTEEEDDDE